MDHDDLKNRFSYHSPATTKKQEAHENIRQVCGGTAYFFNEVLPEGREKSLAVTHLEEAMFWANAALARTE